jgi:hypothetical protein
MFLVMCVCGSDAGGNGDGVSCCCGGCGWMLSDQFLRFINFPPLQIL